MPPLVSIVIPAKNAEAWLAQAIDSCMRQTWRDLQIIVVDNGSSDSSLEVARRYSPSSVTVLQCARPGASAARNVGLESARGKYVQFLDADDIIDADKIRQQLTRLESAPAFAVASAAWARFRHSPGDAAFVEEPVWRDCRPENFLVSSWSGGGMMPLFAWLTPRALIDKAGPWDERLSLNDDGEYFCRVVMASSGILFCREARGYYRSSGPATVSGRRDRSAIESAFLAIDLSCRRLMAHEASAAAAKACATQYQRFAFDVYPDFPDLVTAAERRVAQFGGSDLHIQGGPGFRFLCETLGWKAGARARSALRRIRG